ncbi:hypothetical protein OJAV_G00084380 [Oryzias javanicus]|uniref:Rho GTPase-activating protein 27 n=1 Tax=Oryzias javanicus TaxID=123683 RepID=A0A437D4K3_ORYJA|nr:hypothetical protein OJAV_G00084380 [Oryzias javanicus]
MAATPSMLSKGLGLVLVEFAYQYEGRDGTPVSIKPNERYVLLAKTNDHWWHVRNDQSSKSFYIPAKYVKELPANIPSPLDFADLPNPEPVALSHSAMTPVLVPVPVPIPKTLEETSGSRTKKGDEVMIRLRPDSSTRNLKNENRMSTFGVPLDLQDTKHPSNPAGSAETKTKGTIPTLNATDNKKLPHPLPVQEETKEDPAKPRVPSFSPADPRSSAWPKTQSKASDAPLSTLHKPSSSSENSDKQNKNMNELEKEEPLEEEPLEEEEPLKEEASTDDSREEEESSKEEDSNHIYESIQDLNLDLNTLTERNGTPIAPPAVTPAPAVAPPTQDHSSHIYANVPSLKKTPPSEEASGLQAPPTAVLPPSESLAHLSSSSSSSLMSPSSPSSPQGVWQVHTDQTSGQQFFYHPGTKESRWSIPASPTAADMDHPEVWKQLLDRASAESCVANRSDGSPPPLPAQDYPVDKHADDTDAVFTLPAPQLDLEEQKEPGAQQEQRMMGNGVSEEGLPLQMFSAGHRRISSDITEVASRRHSPDGPQLNARLKLKRNLSSQSTGSHQLHSHLLEKAGIINKTKVADHGKKIRKNWTQSWTVLHGGVLTFHKDPKFAPAGNMNKASQIVPEYTVDLRGASVSWAPKDKSSKRNVLELKTRQGCEYLVQYDTDSIISDWFKVIHDTIYQLDKDHMSEDEDETASDREDRDRKRPSTKSSAGTDSEQRQVRTKLRRFLQRRPTLQSVKEKGYIRDNVFGCHLDTLCHRENTTIPKFVEKCIRAVERRGLDVDGIYRVSGNLAVIQKLRHKADHEEHLDLEDGQWEEIHVITGALKLFFRELPEPLFPFSCFHKFIAAIQLPEHGQRVSYVKDLVRALPLPNYNTMELLCKHLCRVIEHKDSNRMSVQSVAIVFGPTLLWPQTESANMAVFMVFQSQIVELLLREFSTVFSEI